jgi:hypothetical protein
MYRVECVKVLGMRSGGWLFAGPRPSPNASAWYVKVAQDIVSVCGMWVCGMRMRAFCSIATEVFGYAAIWLWAAFEPHNFQTRICAHFDA